MIGRDVSAGGRPRLPFVPGCRMPPSITGIDHSISSTLSPALPAPSGAVLGATILSAAARRASDWIHAQYAACELPLVLSMQPHTVELAASHARVAVGMIKKKK